ncbi:MAG: polysaccharide biosynthesis C-terminal domain-containing protein [Chitinophagales bacterium]
MNPLKKLAGQTVLYGLSSVIGRFLNYLLVPLYTNIFLPEAYGVVTEFYAYVGFFVVLLTYGMETAYFNFASGKKGDEKESYYATGLWSLLGTTSVFLFLALVFSPQIATFLEYPNNPEYIQYFAWILTLDALSALPFARLRLENKAARFAGIKILNISINIGANLFFLVLLPWLIKNEILESLHFLYNPEIGVAYIFISNLLASIVTLIFLLPLFKGLKIGWSPSQWKPMVKYALPLMVVGFAGIVNEMADRIMLKQLLPFELKERMAMIGIYGANYKIAILMTLFIQAFRYAAEPFFFNQASSKDAKKLYVKVLDFFVLFGCLVFLGVLFYIDIVQYFIGEAYRSGLKAVPVLLMANLFLGIQINISIWYKLTGQTKTGALIALATAFITVLFNFLLIPEFYYMGSAWATLIAYVSMVIMTALAGHKYYPVKYNWEKITLYILTALALYLLSANLDLLFQMETTTRLLINTILLLPFILLIWILERKIKG